MRRLSPEEQEFATEYHNMVYSFLHMRRLSIDDYYDVVVFGFLEAVVEYHDKPELQHEYKFSTIAYRRMHFKLAEHWTKAGRQKRKAQLYSIDAGIWDEGEQTLAEIIPFPETGYNDAVCNDMWKRLSDILPDNQLEALRLRMDGFSNKDIAAAWEVDTHQVERLFHKMRGQVPTSCVL